MGPAAQKSPLIASLREQAGWCMKLGSPLYHSLLTSIAADVESGGVCWRFLEPFAADSLPFLPLRFLAMLHRLALEGQWPELSLHYPSCGGQADSDGAWAVIQSRLAELKPEQLPGGVQTNEVARCCALLPGFLRIAEHTRLPMRLLELGSSAGLNLRWDRYRYEAGASAWGDPDSPVVFRDWANGEWTLPAVDVEIRERRGCDLNPIEPTANGMRSILSFTWADQLERFQLLRRAFEVEARVPVQLDRADAVDWTAQRLRELPAGVSTVVFHSIVWMYLSADAQRRLESIFAEAGRRASVEAPLAWLRMERGGAETEVLLTLWPSGETFRVAQSGFHGRGVVLL